MPRKGRKYIAVYPSDEQYFKLKDLAEESGKSISKYVLDKLGLSVVGSEDKPRAERSRKRSKVPEIPAIVGETVVDGVQRGLPMGLTTKQKQAWHKKHKRKY